MLPADSSSALPRRRRRTRATLDLGFARLRTCRTANDEDVHLHAATGTADDISYRGLIYENERHFGHDYLYRQKLIQLDSTTLGR